MRYAFLMLLVFCGLLYSQPFVPVFLGHENWLLNLTPILVTYTSLRARDFSLMFFIILGGLLHDLLLMNYVGMGPLLWGLVAFIVRSQRPWVEGGNWFFLLLMTFVASFAYLSLDRLFFLISEGFWSWNLKLSFEILKLSTVNALLCLPVFWLMDRLLDRPSSERRSSYAHAHR
jgi:hypothetical protein